MFLLDVSPNVPSLTCDYWKRRPAKTKASRSRWANSGVFLGKFTHFLSQNPPPFAQADFYERNASTEKAAFFGGGPGSAESQLMALGLGMWRLAQTQMAVELCGYLF